MLELWPGLGQAHFPNALPPGEPTELIVCNLTKPEAILDQVKKTYTKLAQTDAALIASALKVSGTYALAVYEGTNYEWPTEYEGLTTALLGQLSIIQGSVEAPVKRMTKAALAAQEEEVMEAKVGLIPNFAEGEKLLGDRNDLKTLFGEILQGGVEFQYGPIDIGWQWALDRVNWATVSNGELTRRAKIKATFQGDAVGVEMGLTSKKRKKASEADVVELSPEA
jgi:hypothetical protein